jgi:hypothetical protein
MGWAVFDGVQRALQTIAQSPEELLQDPLAENKFSDKIGALLRQQGYRAASRVNLWQAAADSLRTYDPVKILKAFRHPLQPDVDLLVEDHNDGHRLSGFEIKIIRWSNSSFEQSVPGARIYTGLDQALSLTTYGLDYVCLWHIFAPSMTSYRKAVLEKGIARATEVDDARIEFTSAYSGIIRGILENFRLPIGYIPTGIFIDQAADHPLQQITVGTGVLGVLRAPEALTFNSVETGARIRSLLQGVINKTS